MFVVLRCVGCVAFWLSVMGMFCVCFGVVLSMIAVVRRIFAGVISSVLFVLFVLLVLLNIKSSAMF